MCVVSVLFLYHIPPSSTRIGLSMYMMSILIVVSDMDDVCENFWNAFCVWKGQVAGWREWVWDVWGETGMGNWERGEKIMSLESQSKTGLRPIQKQSFTKLKTSLSWPIFNTEFSGIKHRNVACTQKTTITPFRTKFAKLVVNVQ